MISQRSKTRPLERLGCLIALAIGLGACATAPEPFEYHPGNELKQGPGLLSGEDGAFIIYGKSAHIRANGDLFERVPNSDP